MADESDLHHRFHVAVAQAKQDTFLSGVGVIALTPNYSSYTRRHAERFFRSGE